MDIFFLAVRNVTWSTVCSQRLPMSFLTKMAVSSEYAVQKKLVATNALLTHETRTDQTRSIRWLQKHTGDQDRSI